MTTPPGAPTLEGALRPHAVDVDEVARRYPGPAALVRRILGVLPSAVSTFEIWPPALVTYNLLVPALFDVPKCDMGLGISPELRAMVAHAASRSFGCQYCTAHTAIMGTIVRGPATALQIAGRVVAARSTGDLSRSEEVAVEYADAVAAVPHRLTPELLTELATRHRPDRMEAIVLVATGMGYLNRFMDTLGTTLETAVHDAVREPLAEAGWEPGKHFDPDRIERDRNEGRDTLTRSSRLGLLREIPSAIAYEKEALRSVPGSVGAQEQALRAALGFVPYYVRKIERGGPRRMTVHLLLERLIPPGVDGDARNKMLAAWAMAHRLGNRTLASHFAFLADRVGVTLPELQDALVPPSSPDASARAAALALAHESAGASATVPAPVIEGLSAMHTPAGIVELLVVISTVAALHRYTITFPPEGLEREVEDFVSEAGADLDVPPV